MSDDLADRTHLRPQSEEIEFEGDHLVAVRLEGEGLAVPVRVICQALGLDVDSQGARLRDHDVLAQGLRIVRVRSGDRLRSLVAILHKYIPFWLATISPNQVNADSRPKLVRYQIELVDLLAALYSGERQPALPAPTDSAMGAVQQRLHEALHEVRLARETLLAMQQQIGDDVQAHEIRLTAIEGLMDEQQVAVGGQITTLQQQLAHHTTLTGPQQETIKHSIQRIALRYEQQTGQKIYSRLFSQFCLDLGTPRYDALPAGRYAAALDWLRASAAHYLPNDPDALPPLQEAML